MKFFALVLQSNSERVKNINDNILPKIPQIEIIPAIEGSTNQLEFCLEEREIQEQFLTFCKRGEIACLLSHLQIWKKMVEENIPEAVILEDDSYIEDNFLALFFEIYSELPFDYDFLYLFVHPRCKNKNRSHFSSHLNKGYSSFGTVGYCITKKMILDILPYFNKIYMPIDGLLKWFLEKFERKCFCVKTNMVQTKGSLFHIHKEETDFDSVIRETEKYKDGIVKFDFCFDEGNYLCYPCCDVKDEIFCDSTHTLNKSKDKYLNNPKILAFNSNGSVKGNLEKWFIDPKVSLYVKK